MLELTLNSAWDQLNHLASGECYQAGQNTAQSVEFELPKFAKIFCAASSFSIACLTPSWFRSSSRSSPATSHRLGVQSGFVRYTTPQKILWRCRCQPVGALRLRMKIARSPSTHFLKPRSLKASPWARAAAEILAVPEEHTAGYQRFGVRCAAKWSYYQAKDRR